MNTDTNEITCGCGKSFIDDTGFRIAICPDCEEREKAEREQRQIAEDRLKLERARDEAKRLVSDHTPPRYRGTNTAHPAFNKKLWAQVQAWQPTDDQPWLGLVGESGASKTRCAFLKLAELVTSGVRLDGWQLRSPGFQIATAYDIHAAVTGQYSECSGTKSDSREFLEKVQTCNFLVIDDFGKARNTPAYSAALFGIIDHRHAHNAVTIWTANSTPEQLVAGMGEDMAGPLAGRLIECSTIIPCQ